MKTDLITNALNMAVGGQECEPELILHLDQGVQYRAIDYVLAQHDAGITRSIIRKGNCWDNAAIKSFYARLNVEEVCTQKYKNLAEAYLNVFEYIGFFYNSIRWHSTNDFIRPIEY